MKTDRKVRILKKLFPQSSILLTIRAQGSVLASMYQYYLKRYHKKVRKPLTFQEWCDQGMGSHEVTFYERFNYLAYCEVLATAFDEIHLLPYELLQSRPEEYVGFLEQVTGVDLRDFPHAGKKLNRGLSSREEIHAIHSRYRFGKRVTRAMEKFGLQSLMALGVDTQAYMAESRVKSDVLKSFQSQNRELERFTAFNLGDLGYY